MQPRAVIDNFSGKFSFLSNFYLAQIIYLGKMWRSNEHAYQAAKSEDPVEQHKVQMAFTPGGAKRIGRSLTLRPDWEEVKVDVMRTLIRLKFDTHPELRRKLLETGDAELVEGNTWGDTFWGVCNGIGKNMLGKLLMEYRETMRG